MLYFGHVKQLEFLSIEEVSIVIDRDSINNINLGIYNVEWEPTLAPPLLLEALYNDETITRIEYIREYLDYLKYDLRARCALHELRERIKKESVNLLFTKDDMCDCFRDLLKVYLESEGVKCKYI